MKHIHEQTMKRDLKEIKKIKHYHSIFWTIKISRSLATFWAFASIFYSLKLEGNFKYGQIQNCTHTIRWKLIPVKHGDAQYILIKIFDEELTVKVPFGVQGIWQCSGSVALRSHANFAIWIAFSLIQNRSASIYLYIKFICHPSHLQSNSGALQLK